MVSKLFLGLSLVGAEWVLWFLIFLSVFSVALMFERFFYYRNGNKGLKQFRQKIRSLTNENRWDDSLVYATEHSKSHESLESHLAVALITEKIKHPKTTLEIFQEIAFDSMLHTKAKWDKHLVWLAIIGANAPFIGLFGTVLGIITAFSHLSTQGAGGVTTVMAGIAEALVATAVGLFVAIPAVVAYNLFQQKVKNVTNDAEALKSFLIAKMVRLPENIEEDSTKVKEKIIIEKDDHKKTNSTSKPAVKRSVKTKDDVKPLETKTKEKSSPKVKPDIKVAVPTGKVKDEEQTSKTDETTPVAEK